MMLRTDLPNAAAQAEQGMIARLLFTELEGQRASSFRQQRWCEILLEAGVELEIYNLRGAFGFHVERLTDLEQLTALRKQALQNAPARASVREGFLARVLRRIKHMLLADLFYPNNFLVAATVARRIAHDPRRSILLASSPPFSVVLMASLVKSLFPGKVTFVADMRDAWALHTGIGGATAVKKVIEKHALTRADHLTTVSWGLKNEFDGAYGTKCEVLYNVASHYFSIPVHAKPSWQEHEKSLAQDSIKLVYTGSTPEGFYDLESIARGCAAFSRESDKIGSQVKLVFVGACAEMVRSVERHPGIESNFAFIPHVPHCTAQAMQTHADALLFLAFDGVDNKGVVSTKLFEYLATGRPILPIGLSSGSDVDVLLRRFCGKSLIVCGAKDVSETITRIAREGTDFLPRMEDPEAVKELLDDYRQFRGRVLDALQANA